ncbi:hypothetical protein ACPEOH_001173 [Yersinia enterocolitica]|uniref:Uncharacterized protein n=1 Tax=Yersinia enterocolitica TaxID=630 RepID=A0ABM9S8G1_YEREN|nr:MULTISPECIES: hypothetical protein [Yersinia]EKN3395825.1 hypothetical protein [Yersinia enterocolitica]EKN3571687.1 hypothetical protein [Yersinia enterocolitica]EKN3634485.1 hypothetical protein [Yersinia enterocolitica]EKN3834339.1 hypothetical protein [Yersinia enterocolitica]EKN3981855.1 hypothetical protein [Yersinia enterocolitica]
MSRLLPNTAMYNRDFVSFGGINCAIYLSTLLYHYREWAVPEGWMPLNVELIERITGLAPNYQHTARVALRKQGILRDGMAFDTPALWVNVAKLDELTGGDHA